jgi:hypothetical protein
MSIVRLNFGHWHFTSNSQGLDQGHCQSGMYWFECKFIDSKYVRWKPVIEPSDSHSSLHHLTKAPSLNSREQLPPGGFGSLVPLRLVLLDPCIEALRRAPGNLLNSIIHAVLQSSSTRGFKPCKKLGVVLPHADT